MAQALLIKTANTAMKTVGDIVGIYRIGHTFSAHELLTFDVARIRGSRSDVVAKLREIEIEIETAYRATTTLWSLTRPERKRVWKDVDEKWYFLDVPPKYSWSMALLTKAQKTLLETATTGLDRDIAYKRMIVNPRVWNNLNTVEATDLNTAVLAER